MSDAPPAKRARVVAPKGSEDNNIFRKLPTELVNEIQAMTSDRHPPTPSAIAIHQAGLRFDWDTPLDRLYSRQESFDRYATNLDDLNSYLPLTRLQEFVEEGRIGALTDRFYNVNRGYSQKLMLQTTAPAALEICQKDEVDVAILTPV